DPPLFERDGIYGDRVGAFPDNAARFATLSGGALAVADVVWGRERPDVLHAHDWHAAPSLVYARLTRDAGWAAVPTVLPVHNLAYQGAFDPGELEALGLPFALWDGRLDDLPAPFRPLGTGWICHDGKVNLMKAGIEIADRVTTVSPTYAREI